MPFGSIGKAIGGAFKGASNFGSEFFGQLGRGFGSIPGLQGVQSILANRGGLLGNLAINYLTDAFGVGARYEGGRLGRAQRAFMDAAYPGTNPWERLGTGQGGAAGTVATAGQRLQDRLNKRTLSMQKEIADKNALATVAPAVLQQHPELAGPITKAIAPHVPTVGPNMKTAMSERRFQLDERIRTAEVAVKRANVNVSAYSAATGRLMQQLESGKFEFAQSVKQFEAEVKNQEVAIATTNMMRQLYDSMSATSWKTIKAALETMPGGSTGLFQLLQEQVKKLPSQPVPLPGALRQPMSAPGAGERRRE